MAENVRPFFIQMFAAFCCLQLFSNAQVAQTSSEVATLLGSFSRPLNLTVGRTFLTKVQNSESGLCLNLSNNETNHNTSIVDTSLVSIHVRRVNNTSFNDKLLTFPCLSCPNLTSTSPTAKFVFHNETVANLSCLAGSRFADDFHIVEQSPSRLTDVLSLSLVDRNTRFVNLSEDDSVHLEMPLVRMPNTSRSFKLWCVARPFNAKQWSNSLCTTSQTVISNNQTNLVKCNCSILGYFAVFVDYSNSQNSSGPWNDGGGNFGGNSGSGNSGGGPPAIPDPEARISLSLDADCSILSNESTKANFLNSTKYSVALALNISTSRITDMVAYCGSIVVNFTLLSPDGTNSTLNASLLKLSDLVKTDSLKVPVENNNILPLTLGILVDFNLTIPTRIVSPHYIKKTATTPAIKTTKIQPLVVDYTPFIISVAVILFLLVTCICGTCCAHSWYLSKKKYTEFNSDKVKPKVEEPVVVEEEEEVAPPEFPMTFTERPKVDERQMAKYDWARTSFAQEQTATTAFVTDAAALGPRLIMDCDSDDGSEGPLPPGDVAINVEETCEESGSDEDSDDSIPDEEYDPRNYECEDNFQDGESRASLPRTEEDIVQEGLQHDCENQEVQETGESVEDEERTGGEEDTEERRDSEDFRQEDEENHNPDEDDNEHDDDVTNDNMSDNDIQDHDVNDDQDIQDNEDNGGTTEDNDGTPEIPQSRSEGASSRMDGGGTTRGGLPEPSM